MRKIAILVILPLLMIIIGCKKRESFSTLDGSTGTNKWYWFLCPDIKVVTDFTLKAGDFRKFIIHSENKRHICFTTDLEVLKESEMFKLAPIKRYPILMFQPQTDISCSNRLSEGAIYPPVDGKIELVVTNQSLDNFKICIYYGRSNDSN